MKIWTGVLILNGPRNTEGQPVDARIILSATVTFEVHEGGKWRTAKASEIHAASWLRALAETGKEVA